MKKWMVVIAVAALSLSVFAAVQTKKEKADCCDKKVVAQVDHAKADQCEDKKGACGGCGDKKMSAEDAFMAEAHKMMMQAEGKEACCKSTASHPMKKGDAGCCNAKGAPAKFKVFVAGEGYKYFGCKESAEKGRTALSAKGAKVGKVQIVASKTSIG